MATVNFLYRSTKESAFLNVRLLFRQKHKDFVYGAKTKLEVSKHYWTKQHNLKRVKDIDLINLQSSVLDDMRKIEKFILETFQNTHIGQIDKKWLQSQMKFYYNPIEVTEKHIPNTLVEYITFYIESRRNEIKPASEKKFNVIKHKMERLQIHRGFPILIKEINENFKSEFVDYYKMENYSLNTIHRELGLIKTFCKHAKYNGVETHPQLDNLKLNKEKTEHIYLTFKELDHIDKKEYNSDYLINAKDWLIISCFTGQRISDFMRFSKDMIRIENGKHLIEFTQKKTGKVMTVPLHSKVLEVLKRRNGNFPRKISDQKYNDYLKEVCSIAGLNEVVVGKIQKNIAKDPKKESIIRNVEGNYEKWELVTSHIGRRSFATNFYGIIPTSLLIYATGHSTESMFLNYIGKSNKDMAMELTNYF